MHLVEAVRQKILLDCGFLQGKRAESYERNKNFPFPPSDIDTVVLSHAHIDHCGNLPHLTRRGFKGPIYCTPATRDLTAVMLADSAKIQAEDADHLNRHKRPSDPIISALYDFPDVRRTMQLARPVPYQTDHDIGDGITVRFLDAGHLLGSAIVHLAFDGGRTITFTGDLGRKD